MKKVRESIVRQVASNSDINLFYDNIADIATTNQNFSTLLHRLIKAGDDISAGELNELIDFTVETSLGALYGMNQYIAVTPEHRQELHDIYCTTWDMIKQSGEIEQTLINHHYPAIREWLKHLYPAELAGELRNVEKINRVVCEEYSAELQIAILGIDTGRIMEPVIDVGCGKSYYLVKHLRELGMDCIGIDRQLYEKRSYLHESSWLEFDFRPGVWGTVIANMSFSNHMMYHYTMKSSAFPKHAHKYHEILESLRPDGMFVYAPGVEFIEEYIDRDTCHVTWIPSPAQRSEENNQ